MFHRHENSSENIYLGCFSIARKIYLRLTTVSENNLSLAQTIQYIKKEQCEFFLWRIGLQVKSTDFTPPQNLSQ
jgi:hypothetical protein